MLIDIVGILYLFFFLCVDSDRISRKSSGIIHGEL